MEEIKYCRKCGAELDKSACGADQIKIGYNDSMGGCKAVVDKPFDKITGKRNVVEILTCPKWKKYFSSHDKIVKYKGEYHWI